MRFRRTACIGAAAAIAATGLIATAPAASAADQRLESVFTVNFGETRTLTGNCPSGAPYLVRAGLGISMHSWLEYEEELKIQRGADAHRWTATVKNMTVPESGIHEGVFAVTYTCSTTPTTYPKYNNAVVRSGEPPLRTPMDCPSAYPLFDTGTSKQGTGETKTYSSPQLQADSNSTVAWPTGYPQKVYLTFTSSYPANTTPQQRELVSLGWVCAR
ncbi:hypothetical protein [Streptomyces sp. V4I2]|uniref:hypothetical protein n=1 Tax=Streptomyces sp. V4I2 TaxID=3042280 RepID=UPI00277E0DE6|nr:hypothetical protein [Streptomyces sp. V4I2]MDQ1042080.1 hypothetical protein [Streptomyces sp. V4I2]